MRFLNHPRIASSAIRVLGWPDRVLARLQEQAKFRACTAHETVRLFPGSNVINPFGEKDRIQIGPHTISRGELNLFKPGGNIVIGSYCYLGDHSRIWSAAGVTVGDRVLISHMVNIHDHDSHSRVASQRHQQAVEIFSGVIDNMKGVSIAPIHIEDDVWIGFNASIMKGVTIGKGAIVGAASVVTKSVQPYAIVVGNPARQIGLATE